jgi:Tfp pilus assembly protein PilN
MKPFNLLQYPALASQRRRFHSRWTSLSGLLVGSLVGFWLMSEVQEKRLQQVQEGAALQSRLKQMQNQQTQDKVRQAQQNTWLQQDARIKMLSAQQSRWEALQQALLHEAGPDSVQLLRLQLDAQTLELHGQAKDVQRMAQARARLSKPLSEPPTDAAWTLVSLVNAAGAQGAAPQAPLEFVWQAPWPQVGSGSMAAQAAATQSQQSTVPDKERP